MPRPIDEKHLAAICGVIERAPDGCAFSDVAAALNSPPPRRNLQRWLAALVRQKRVIRVGRLKSTRYRMTQPGEMVDDIEADLQPLPIRKGSAAHAIQILVARPLAERPAVAYRRAWLDAYQPNKTWYLPEDVRKQLLNAPGVPGGAALLQDPAWRSQFTEDVVLAGLVLEGEEANRWGVKLLLAERPVAEKVPRVKRLAWNIRRVVDVFASKGGPGALSAERILEMADQVDMMIICDENQNPIGESPIRIGPVTLPGSSYQPPPPGATLRATFEQVVATAAAVKDPFEQAFFLFLHLLYLQPFNLNFATACLAANVPLVLANVRPLAFATVPPRELHAGVRGVCELNRLGLLREVFLRAYFDRLSLPADHPYRAQPIGK